MSNKLKISKSSFIRGKQCLKSLYLLKKHPELRDQITEAQQAIFSQGHRVGELAQQLFPGGILAAFDLPEGFMKSMNYTQQLLKDGKDVIYEAGFIYQNTHCFVDILMKENGSWKICEVKSSTEVKEVNVLDAAFQYYILNGLGMQVSDVSIIHINNQYERLGEIEVEQLFKIESVFDQVKELQPVVINLLKQENEVLQSPEAPAIEIGRHCSDPYECDFMGHCWKHIPDYSIFNISRLRSDKKFELYENGIIEVADVPDSWPLNPNQLLQVNSDKTGEVIIDKDGIKDFVASLNYPLYFLDFETINPTIPLYDYSRPYQQIVFQYSLHIIDEPNGALMHKEFLGNPHTDPRLPMIEQLINEIGPKGDIVVYNKGFEMARLNEIATNFPKYQPIIQNMLDRIIDLMTPFQQKLYYTPEMRGSYSIKKVLPALCPGFSYANLTINNGGDASQAFIQLIEEKDQFTIDETRKNLLEYCKLDTLAMVEILDVLKKV